MPVTTGNYANYELHIFQSLLKEGLNTAAACGVLANIYAESGFNPMNLQNSYESSLGYNDSSYTKAVNNGTYKNFAGDSAGYGLAQWTYHTRKRALYNYAQRRRASIGNLETQVEFLIMELKGETSYGDFKRVWSMLSRIDNSAQGAYEAGYEFCKEFEKPAGGTATYQSRGNSARDVYWKFYSANSKESAQVVEDKGQKIVEIARAQVGKSYIPGGYNYNTELKGTDNPGLIYYVYQEAGVDIPQSTVSGYYDMYQTARKVDISNISAGDLLFYDDDQNIGNGVERIAIANGEGGIIYSDSGGIVEVNTIGQPSLIIRLVADSETSQDTMLANSDAESGAEYEASVSHETQLAQMSTNLSRVASVGYDAGYLIDLTYGGDFKFYVPEFTEQAGAQWGSIEIRGRSVDVKSYDYTSSRNITISLDLYAGVGYYAPRSGESGEDTVSRLHSDAYFLKSLEYPDYSNAITRPPATVQLILGSAVNIVGVVSNVIVEHLKPHDSQKRAMYIKVSFTVTQTAVNPPDWSDIRRGQTSIISTANRDSLDAVGLTDTTTVPRTTTNLPELPGSTNAPTFAQSPQSDRGRLEQR